VWYCYCLRGVSSLSFLGGEEPPIFYVQDVHIIIVECVLMTSVGVIEKALSFLYVQSFC